MCQNEGYISEYEKIEDGKQGVIKVTLKYAEKTRVIKGIKRISKPGLRVYAKANELPKVLNGLGIAIISTSNGIMTDREARLNKLGGEVVAFVWQEVYICQELVINILIFLKVLK